MTFFEAYLLLALLPNISVTLVCFGVVALLLLIAAWVVWFADYRDVDDGAILPLLKKCTLYCFLIVIGAILTPSESQIAKIFAAKLATSKQAQEFYGEAGDYMKQWLINQTEELKKENGK